MVPSDETMTERNLVWLAGNKTPVLQQAHHMLANQVQQTSSDDKDKSSVLWVGDCPQPPHFVSSCVTAEAATRLIGMEHDQIVFNAFDRFNVDAFAAICGTLCQGGWFYLLTPPREDWPSRDQLELDRYSVYRAEQVEREATSDYIQWFTGKLVRACDSPTNHQYDSAPEDMAVVARHLTKRVNQPDSRQPPVPALAANTGTGAPAQPSQEQQLLLDDVLPQLSGPNSIERKAWIITADRGRGKSALAGMLAARLAQTGKHLSVTGPSRHSATILFRHFVNATPANLQHTMSFIPPDELIKSRVLPTLLLIDEAAALPLPVLSALIERVDQVVITTTVHGYEGAGRGFAIRMKDWLDAQSIPNQWMTLDDPIRWPKGDALETFCNDVFMLGADYAPVPTGNNTFSVDPSDCAITRLSLSKPETNESVIRQSFALLVQAHYQTKPMDLRHMFDGENLETFVMMKDSVVIGTALIALEGPLPAEDSKHLHQAIVERQRRPRGHLIPQLLAQWTLLEVPLTLMFARVVRIAIHPRLQRQGLGSYFLDQLEQQMTERHPVAGFGAVFGADERTTRFWNQNGYQCFHLGKKKNNRSGLRSAAVIKNVCCPPTLIDKAMALYKMSSVANLSTETADKSLEAEVIAAYLERNRAFEDSRFALKGKLVEAANRPIENLSLDQQELKLLEYACLPDFEFKQFAAELGYTGKAETEAAFKNMLRKVL